MGDDAKKMPFQVESEIEIVEPMGSDTVAWTKIAGQSVTFRCSSDIPLHAGQMVTLGFDPSRGSVFDCRHRSQGLNSIRPPVLPRGYATLRYR